MNWSMYTADRATHLKIVVVGLAAALLIAVIGISARELKSWRGYYDCAKSDRSSRLADRLYSPTATRRPSVNASSILACSSTRRICGAFCCEVAESAKMADNIPT